MKFPDVMPSRFDAFGLKGFFEQENLRQQVLHPVLHFIEHVALDGVNMQQRARIVALLFEAKKDYSDYFQNREQFSELVFAAFNSRGTGLHNRVDAVLFAQKQAPLGVMNSTEKAIVEKIVNQLQAPLLVFSKIATHYAIANLKADSNVEHVEKAVSMLDCTAGKVFDLMSKGKKYEDSLKQAVQEAPGLLNRGFCRN